MCIGGSAVVESMLGVLACDAARAEYHSTDV